MTTLNPGQPTQVGKWRTAEDGSADPAEMRDRLDNIPPVVGGPNEPVGLTFIGDNDGSVLGGISGESSEPAFGITGFNQWFEFNGAPNIELSNDPTNPSGSGSVIEINISDGGRGAIATAPSFPGGPWEEMYWSYRIFRDGVTDDESAHKWFYYGMHQATPPASSNNYVDTPFTAAPRTLRLSTNNAVFINDSSALPFDEWLNVEIHLVAESSEGAGDGQGRAWVNGASIGESTDITFHSSTEISHLFNGMHWYAHHSGHDRVIRYLIGSMYIAGRPA